MITWRGVDYPDELVPIDLMRAHWRDPNAGCNQLRQYRDTVMRWYWFMASAPDHGRRWRGRELDRADRWYGWARQHCAICRASVQWESGGITRGAGAPWR